MKLNLTHLTDKIRKNFFIVIVVSLLWLLFRSGEKPSRISYPCQKAAVMNVGFFGSLAIFSSIQKFQHLLQIEKKMLLKYAVVASLIFVFLMGVSSLLSSYQMENELQKYQLLSQQGPVGKPLTAATGGTLPQYATIPHAFSLPSPHRVVSVYDPEATNWTYCTTGCPYYGDDVYVDQNVVDEMIERGVMELTGTGSVADAWSAILPDYQVGEKIAIKVNFNTGNSYDDNDAMIDEIPQPINSIIRGLKLIGVQESDIWIYDASRYIPDRFRTRIHFPDVKYFDHYGTRAGVTLATFNSSDPSAWIDFSGTGYTGSHKVSDVLVNATYLINVPVFKRHGGAGITLSLKNHLGTVDGFYTGQQNNMHDYFFLSGSHYSSSSNPLVNINSNQHIKNKTILIIGDALYGSWPENYQPPSKWNSFGLDSPNMMFFSSDPVAVDSVMYDYLRREGSFNAKSEDILILAANAGLGVHERWNNNFDRKYSNIDYIEINMTQLVKKPTGTITGSVKKVE